MNAKWKENACKLKEDKRTWMHIGMKMKGTWRENEYKWKEHERKMQGTCEEMTAKWKQNACKWKEHEGKWREMHAKWKEDEVLPKHLKPTKQLLDPFTSLFRNGFWLHVGSWMRWFPQNITRPSKAIGPPKSDNHNNSNYPDVEDFDGSSYVFSLHDL